jgi:hypothetical protein
MAYKLSRAYEFKSPWGGNNYKSYPGLANMPSGEPSTLLLESKHGETDYADAFDTRATSEVASAAAERFAFDLAFTSENIRQCRVVRQPDMAVLWIVGDSTGTTGDAFINYAKSFIETAMRDGSLKTIRGVSNPKWFSEYLYFGKCRGYVPGMTMELPDTVWRYSYRTGRFHEEQIANVLKPGNDDGMQQALMAAALPAQAPQEKTNWLKVLILLAGIFFFPIMLMLTASSSLPNHLKSVIIFGSIALVIWVIFFKRRTQ